MTWHFTERILTANNPSFILSTIIMLRMWYSIADVVTIEKTGENFRLIYDTKGRFTVHRISPEEASVSWIEVLGEWLKVSSAVMTNKA